MKFILRTFALFTLCFFSFQLSATHLMGGNITYECIGNNTYLLKAELYRDCNGIDLPASIQTTVQSVLCGASLYITMPMDTNSPEIVTPICALAPDVCNNPLGIYGVEKRTYYGTVVLTGSCSDWIVSWSSCCRNSAITTLMNGGSEAFYLHTNIDNTIFNCNNSPVFDFDPLFYACVGDTAVYTHGVYDSDGDDLVFSLVDCMNNETTPVSYATGFSATNPLTTSYFQVDAVTGNVKFVPTILEVGVICMLVEEFRNGVKIGEVKRDIQIAIRDCLGNQIPVLSGINGIATANGVTGSNTISIVANQSTCFTIDGFDANPTQTLAIQYTNALPGATYSINSTGNTTQVTICWTPTSNDIGTHNFAMSVSDDACPITAVSNYGYVINVVPVTIQGTVTRSDGLPLNNSIIYLLNSNFTIIDSSFLLFQNTYSFVVPDATLPYYVKAEPGISHGDQISTYYMSSPVIQYADSISIVNTTNIADFSTLDTFSLLGEKNIGGTVNSEINSTLTPLANIRLILEDANGNYINDAITDNNGKFTFYDLTNGTYKILVDKAGVDNDLAPVVELKTGETAPENLDFLLHYYLQMSYPTSTTKNFNVQNISIYPNPIQTTFTIEYDLSAFANVQIDVLDVNGKVISTLLNENQVAGEHNLKIDEAEQWSKGVYFIHLMVDGKSVIQKVIKQ